MLLLENSRWQTLMCSLRVRDDFGTNLSRSYRFIYFQALFNGTIHKSKMYKTWREEFWSPTWRLTLNHGCQHSKHRHIGDCISHNFMHYFETIDENQQSSSSQLSWLSLNFWKRLGTIMWKPARLYCWCQRHIFVPKIQTQCKYAKLKIILWTIENRSDDVTKTKFVKLCK